MGLFRRGARNRTTDHVADAVDEPDAADTELSDGELSDGKLSDGEALDDGAASGEPDQSDSPEESDDPVDAGPRPGAGGPWDVSERSDLGRRVDLGAIWVPGVTGMELRMEIDKATDQVTAVALNLNGSALQIQAFAAPRTDGIWDEIRAEIADSVSKQGGSADDLPGPFGRELLARLPVRTPEGRTGHRPARFIGHDGPRWFLRGVLTGKAAVDPEAARDLEEIFADIVVIRGAQARAPRDLLTLTLPGQAGQPAPVVPETNPSLDPMRRGPEITEIH